MAQDNIFAQSFAIELLVFMCVVSLWVSQLLPFEIDFIYTSCGYCGAAGLAGGPSRLLVMIGTKRPGWISPAKRVRRQSSEDVLWV